MWKYSTSFMHVDSQAAKLYNRLKARAISRSSLMQVQNIAHTCAKICPLGGFQGQIGASHGFTGQLHGFSIPIRWRRCSTKFVQAAATAACRMEASVSSAATCLPSRRRRRLRLRNPSGASCIPATPLSEPFEYAGFWLRVWAGAIDIGIECLGALMLTFALDFALSRFGRLLRTFPFRFQSRRRHGVHHDPGGRVVAVLRVHRKLLVARDDRQATAGPAGGIRRWRAAHRSAWRRSAT